VEQNRITFTKDNIRQLNYEEMRKRYHFRRADLERLRRLGDEALFAVEPVMYCAPYDGSLCAVIVSLGAKIDALQDGYSAQGCLIDAYMIECIAMELLKNTYELAAAALHEAYGLWMDGYDFLGERYPIELTADVFKLLQPKEISYNQAYMLTPKKTVIFLTTLQQERQDSYCHVCGRCSNMACPNRRTEHLNYGYQRIFGKN
jgi:hypothetical protein